MALSVDHVYRDYNTQGVPASGDFKPRKPEIRALLKQTQNQSGQSVTRNTFTALSAVTPPNENYMGIVLDDPDASKNGYYSRVAAAWVWERGFPDTFAELTQSSGTNNVIATSAAGTYPARVEVFHIEPTATNSGNVTLAVDSQPAKPVRSVNGAELAPGEWTAGRKIMLVEGDTEYRLLSDPDADGAAASAAASATAADASADAAAIDAADAAVSAAAADADRIAAEAARDIAVGAGTSTYQSLSAMPSTTVPAALTQIRVNSQNGGGGLFGTNPNRKGLVENVNPDFTSDASSWTLGPGFSYASGGVERTAIGLASYVLGAVPLTPDVIGTQWYIVFNVSNYVSGTFASTSYDGSVWEGSSQKSGNGDHYFVHTTTTGNLTSFGIETSTDFIGKINLIYVQKVLQPSAFKTLEGRQWYMAFENGMHFVDTIEAFKAISVSPLTTGAIGLSAFWTDPVKGGHFAWTPGDFTAEVAADTTNGKYVKANSTAASAGVWRRTNETHTVLMFGADPTGVANSNTAFSMAAKVAEAQNEVEGARRNFPAADVAYVSIPPGEFLLTSLLDVGNREIYWILEPGARVVGADYLNGHLIRHNGSTINKSQPTGILYGAVAGSAMIRDTLDAQPEITGFDNVNQLGVYPSRDAVSFFSQAESVPALATLVAPTYDATHIYPATPLSSDQVKRLRKGMIIDVGTGPLYSGAIKSWASNGTSIEVDTGWYAVTGSVSAPTTPPNGTAAMINAYSKLWAFNGNVYLHAGHPATKATVMELGFINASGVAMTDGMTAGQPYAWIFDAVTLGGVASKVTAGYVQRGEAYYGFLAEGADAAFAAKHNGSVTFRVDRVTGSVEMGSTVTASTPTWDFHSSGNAVDYDSRLIAIGGSGTAGQGYLRVDGSHLDIDSAGGLRVTGTKVVGPQGAAIADTDATPANIAATVNLILARMRAHGLIAT